MGILLLCGAILILGAEICAFLGIMGYKKLRNELSDEEWSISERICCESSEPPSFEKIQMD